MGDCTMNISLQVYLYDIHITRFETLLNFLQWTFLNRYPRVQERTWRLVSSGM
jgi:hypothetical protein